MLKTIEQVASQLNVSKATIYNKIKLECFKDTVVTKLGVSMLDDETIALIETDIKSKRNYKPNDKPNDNVVFPEGTGEPEKLEDVMLGKDYIRLNKDYIDHLKNEAVERDIQFTNQLNVKDLQLNAKDLQINNLNERLKQEQELNKNSQILLREKPQQDILLLEEHFQDLDTKLEEVKENMQHRKEHQKSKGFFSKIFKGDSLK